MAEIYNYNTEELRERVRDIIKTLKRYIEQPPLWDYDNQQEVDETYQYGPELGEYSYNGKPVHTRQLNSKTLLDKALEVQYYGNDAGLSDAHILMMLGGPTVYISTALRSIVAAWGDVQETIGYTDNIGLSSQVRNEWRSYNETY